MAKIKNPNEIKKKIITLSLDENLIKEIDKEAKENDRDRSGQVSWYLKRRHNTKESK